MQHPQNKISHQSGYVTTMQCVHVVHLHMCVCVRACAHVLHYSAAYISTNQFTQGAASQHLRIKTPSFISANQNTPQNTHTHMRTHTNTRTRTLTRMYTHASINQPYTHLFPLQPAPPPHPAPLLPEPRVHHTDVRPHCPRQALLFPPS